METVPWTLGDTPSPLPNKACLETPPKLCEVKVALAGRMDDELLRRGDSEQTLALDDIYKLGDAEESKGEDGVPVDEQKDEELFRGHSEAPLTLDDIYKLGGAEESKGEATKDVPVDEQKDDELLSGDFKALGDIYKQLGDAEESKGEATKDVPVDEQKDDELLSGEFKALGDIYKQLGDAEESEGEATKQKDKELLGGDSEAPLGDAEESKGETTKDDSQGEDPVDEQKPKILAVDAACYGQELFGAAGEDAVSVMARAGLRSDGGGDGETSCVEIDGPTTKVETLDLTGPCDVELALQAEEQWDEELPVVSRLEQFENRRSRVPRKPKGRGKSGKAKAKAKTAKPKAKAKTAKPKAKATAAASNERVASLVALVKETDDEAATARGKGKEEATDGTNTSMDEGTGITKKKGTGVSKKKGTGVSKKKGTGVSKKDKKGTGVSKKDKKGTGVSTKGTGVSSTGVSKKGTGVSSTGVSKKGTGVSSTGVSKKGTGVSKKGTGVTGVSKKDKNGTGAVSKAAEVVDIEVEEVKDDAGCPKDAAAQPAKRARKGRKAHDESDLEELSPQLAKEGSEEAKQAEKLPSFARRPCPKKDDLAIAKWVAVRDVFKTQVRPELGEVRSICAYEDCMQSVNLKEQNS